MGNYRDGYLQRGAPLGMVRKQVNLVADNTAIDVQGISMLYLTSDNTTASNRTFTLAASSQLGQELTLVFESGSSYTCQLADSGNCKLSAAWEPLQYDALKLFWDGTYWIESSRTAASGTLDIPLADAHILVGNSSGLAADVAMSGDVAIANTGATTIQAGAVGLTKLASAVAPSHIVKYAGQHTTVGGAAAEAITVTGLAATDLVFVQMKDDGTGNVTIVNAVPTTNTLTVTFSGNPGNDAVIYYQALRATS